MKSRRVGGWVGRYRVVGDGWVELGHEETGLGLVLVADDEPKGWVGGWVGGLGRIEENEAVRMRCCKGGGRKVGGWMVW